MKSIFLHVRDLMKIAEEMDELEVYFLESGDSALSCKAPKPTLIEYALYFSRLSVRLKGEGLRRDAPCRFFLPL